MHRLLSVLAVTGRVYHQTRTATRAAALSFSSLLGLGPLIALIVVLGTPILGQRDPLLAAKALDRMLHLIAPQIAEYEDLSTGGAGPSFNPKLMEIIDGFVTGAHRGSAGTFGAISLLVIVVLLFGTIEHAFNDIWGVRTGRTFFRTIVFHLVFLLAGALLFFSAATCLSAATFISVFIERLPPAFHPLTWVVPVGACVYLAGVLAIAYRFIPNTRVRWRSAALGGGVATLLMLINNFLAFLYVRRVLLTRSLYGSLGLVPVLMLGLYVFWLFVLIGGQISFAVQNTPAPGKTQRFSP